MYLTLVPAMLAACAGCRYARTRHKRAYPQPSLVENQPSSNHHRAAPNPHRTAPSLAVHSLADDSL